MAATTFKDRLTTISIIGVIGWYIWYIAIYEPPIEAVYSAVTGEKVLCTQSGRCFQEVYFLDDRRIRRKVYKSDPPWYSVGEDIEVVRQEKKMTGGGRRWGDFHSSEPSYEYWLPKGN